MADELTPGAPGHTLAPIASNPSLHAPLARGQAHFVQNLHHADAAAGSAAFLGKRVARDRPVLP